MKTSACTTPVGTMSKSVKKEPGWESVRQSRAFCRFSSVSYLGIGALFHSRHGDFKVLRMWSVHSAETTGGDCFRLGMWCRPGRLRHFPISRRKWTRNRRRHDRRTTEHGEPVRKVAHGKVWIPKVKCRIQVSGLPQDFLIPAIR